MRIDLYPYNEAKILKAAHELGKSPTQLVNEIVESVNIIIKLEIEKVDLKFSKVKLEPKESGSKTNRKPGKNFAKEW